MRCEKSFITIKLIWHGYLVHSLSICAHKIPTETGLSAQWVMHARLCLIITLPRFISSQSLLSVVLLHECNSHLNPFLLLFPLVIAGKIRYRCTPHAHITQTYLFTNLTDAHTTNLKVTSRIILPVLTFCGPCFLA